MIAGNIGPWSHKGDWKRLIGARHAICSGAACFDAPQVPEPSFGRVSVPSACEMQKMAVSLFFQHSACNSELVVGSKSLLLESLPSLQAVCLVTLSWREFDIH